MCCDQDTIDAAYPSGGFPTEHPLARIRRAKRAAVWEACGGRCTYYCGRVMNPWRDFSIDHVLPRSRGGTNALDNLVGCCLTCNQAKGDTPERAR